MKSVRPEHALFVAAVLGLTLAACADSDDPTVANAVAVTAPTAAIEHHSSAHSQKGYIGGWLDGEVVQLRYTRLYFCEEPPASAAASDCVVGADAEVTPRGGPIDTIYAIAGMGIQPDPATLHCPGGSVCLNHPSTLDLSRIGGPPSALGAPHSHIITGRRSGWHQTVNIRVRSLAVWNQIAAAKTIAKVRELQNDPAVGGANPALISQDTPTNIFFFIEVQKP